MYIYVFGCPRNAGRELGVQRDFQKTSTGVLGTFFVHSNCGLCQWQVYTSSFDS